MYFWKKITKAFTNCSFRTLFGQKLGQQRPCPKSSSIFFSGDNKRIISFQELFISSKYHKFWLSYGWFSVLYEILLPKPAISSWKKRAPCCCLWVLKKTATDSITNIIACATEAITENFYMDDYLDSCNTQSKAMEISQQVMAVLKDSYSVRN